MLIFLNINFTFRIGACVVAGVHTHGWGGEKRGAECVGRDQLLSDRPTWQRDVLRTCLERLGLRSKPRKRYAAKSMHIYIKAT